ncbi:hypothetical protein LCGC14_1925140 [marine sediment metagenome]|uniref:Uncharacterized protein n=1 Tax=marine sediment metagenome TaxID=412755 RepID=A0A0F9FPI7_9ZZZZ
MEQPSQREQHLSADADSLRGVIRQLDTDYARVQRKWEKSERVNAKLLAALEQAVLFIEGVFPEPSPLLKQELASYRNAIEEAKK